MGKRVFSFPLQRYFCALKARGSKFPNETPPLCVSPQFCPTSPAWHRVPPPACSCVCCGAQNRRGGLDSVTAFICLFVSCFVTSWGLRNRVGALALMGLHSQEKPPGSCLRGRKAALWSLCCDLSRKNGFECTSCTA